MTMTAMEHAQSLGLTSGARSEHAYYRQPNGWITVSPITELDELRYRREGWEPLPQYGHVEMTTEYVVDHPLEVLFMFGGAHELPVDQIIEMGLHLNPPLVPTCGKRLSQSHKKHNANCWVDAEPVSFPQLKESPSGFPCRFCDRLPFPSEKARTQHEGVMHKDEKGDIRTGETLADSIVRGLKGAPETPQERRLPYACGLCDKSYRFAGHLKRHVEEEHKDG